MELDNEVLLHQNGHSSAYPKSTFSDFFEEVKPKAATAKEKVASLARYIDEHPDQRFWQALCNWADLGHIGIAKHYDAFSSLHSQWEDTFHLED